MLDQKLLKLIQCALKILQLFHADHRAHVLGAIEINRLRVINNNKLNCSCIKNLFYSQHIFGVIRVHSETRDGWRAQYAKLPEGWLPERQP